MTDLLRAEIAHEMGNDEDALELAGDLRDARPHGLVVNRARRLVERIRKRPDEEPGPTERLAEAELRLAEGDAQGAQREALVVLGAAPTREARDHALWIQARAARDLGTREAAEGLCLALATSEPGPYSARALAEVARWRWNEDDDAGRAASLPRPGAALPGKPRGARGALRHRTHPAGERLLRRRVQVLHRVRRALSVDAHRRGGALARGMGSLPRG